MQIKVGERKRRTEDTKRVREMRLRERKEIEKSEIRRKRDMRAIEKQEGIGR